MMVMTSSDDESPKRCCVKITFNLFWMKLSRNDLNNISAWSIKLKIAFENHKYLYCTTNALEKKPDKSANW